MNEYCITALLTALLVISGFAGLSEIRRINSQVSQLSLSSEKDFQQSPRGGVNRSYQSWNTTQKFLETLDYTRKSNACYIYQKVIGRMRAFEDVGDVRFLHPRFSQYILCLQRQL